MAILKIARMGHPCLRAKSEPVTPEELGSSDLQRWIDNLAETMREAGGVGLAAPQVHFTKKIIVVEI